MFVLKKGITWKGRVVFINEIVPKRMITYVARLMYSEHYHYPLMRHTIQSNDKNILIRYEWKLANEWNGIHVNVDATPYWAFPNSKSSFIIKNCYVYTKRAAQVTSAYQVMHPSWQIYKIHCNAAALYGAAFTPVLSQAPQSVFLAEGSSVKIINRQLLRF